MTEKDWETCVAPLPMLIFLRGDVREEEKRPPILHCHYGKLYGGPGARITPEQCRYFILQCLLRLYTLELDGPSRDAIEAYRRYAIECAPWQNFSDACKRIHKVLIDGGSAIVSHMAEMWSDNPIGAANACSDVAVIIANVKAKDSVAITCANFTEDDWFECGFTGPPDELWRATRSAEEKFQADVLRNIVGNPFGPG